jgi:hypothetical protein
MKKILLVAVIATALTGCAAPVPTAVTKYQNVVAVPPKSYMGHCGMPKPPSKDAYIHASKDERITMLLKANSALMKVIKDCNDRLDQIDIWGEKQLQLYSNDPIAVFPGQAPATPAQGASSVAPSK